MLPGVSCHQLVPAKSRLGYPLVVCVLIVLAEFAVSAPLDQPAPDVLVEARRIVHEMAASPRGPYSRIRWFCNDGTVQEPVAYACREHGGGRQHAEFSADRRRLAELGWNVGTIFAALSYEELINAAPRQQRLRELALEQYLVDIDNGWVLQRAQSYRGRVQVEDETWSGRELLNRLMSDSGWVFDNFLLVREASRVIPHGEDTDLARTVRRSAIELAELDPAAERWRAEIHTSPNASTAGRLRRWLSSRADEKVLALGEQLAADLDRLYGSTGRRERIDASLGKLRTAGAGKDWRIAVMNALTSSGAARVAGLCSELANARSSVFAAIPDADRIALVDAMQGLETEVLLTFQDMKSSAALTRGDTLNLSRSLIDCAYGSGLLSATEHASLASHLEIDGQDVLSLEGYRDAIARLKRAPGWAVGTIRYTFAEALTKYTALDARSARFSDDMLRSSPMWMLGDTLKDLSKDLDFLSGSVVEMHNVPVASAVALNAGVARGTLRIFETIEAVEAASLAATDVVVLPETIAELSPISGILTLGEGNALSHVQLLARNFGIPNVAIGQDAVDQIRELENKQVILVVDKAGNVILREFDTTVSVLFETLADSSPKEMDQILVPVPDLSVTDFLPLAEIGRGLSGKVVGPKAANLGELNRLFPGRVAPAVAIPFGVYAAHLQGAGLMERIGQIFADNAAGVISKSDFDAQLAGVRKEITALALSEKTRAGLTTAMQAEFGDAGTYGVFVRSDTNVEDLPQFTGAGLNETVPNVVGLDAQLATVPRVWSSVFSPRALAWRSSVLANPAQIYASVLLMKSVPATKSGVLVTANLFDRDASGLTVSAAWGVGGAVAGEPAESIVIYDDEMESFSEAKSPYQRGISSVSGVEWLAAPSGRVLAPDEMEQLRALAAEVNKVYSPVFDEQGKQRPWDIEFGFVEGELTLFQIRPLVERVTQDAAAVIRLLQPQVPATLDRSLPVPLSELPRT